VTLPGNSTASQEQTKEGLAFQSGHSFDDAYIKVAIANHKAAIREFEDESTSRKDSDLKAYAARTLPLLESELRMLLIIGSARPGTDSTP
jgi:putative membrane protein